VNDHKFLNAVGNISDEYLLEALFYRERKSMVKYFSKVAAAIFAAIEVAKKLGAGKKVLALTPDNGERYLSTALYEFDA